MKISRLFLSLPLAVMLITGCDQAKNVENKAEPEAKELVSSLSEKTISFDFIVAGHLTDNDDKTVALLGPEKQRWIIQKKDIIKDESWDQTYKNVSGTPKILTIKFGAVIRTEDGILTVGKEIRDINNPDVLKSAAGCNCEVSCGGGSCCAINGFRTYCSGRSCIQTTEKC